MRRNVDIDPDKHVVLGSLPGSNIQVWLSGQIKVNDKSNKTEIVIKIDFLS